MASQKAKFELFARIQALGFTYEEAVSLRRIEMTLQRWGEMECGNDRGCIERDDQTGKPFFTYERGPGQPRGRYAVADKEAGALKRLAAILSARNARERSDDGRRCASAGHVLAYHQGDCRGCNLYLVKRSDLPADYFAVVWCGDGYSITRNSGRAGEPMGTPYAGRSKTKKEAQARAEAETLSAFYTRGLAVCA